MSFLLIVPFHDAPFFLNKKKCGDLGGLKITSLNGGVTIYHNIANGDTTLGDSGGDHLHKRALAQVNVHVRGGGNSNGIHDCVVYSIWRMRRSGVKRDQKKKKKI